MATECSVAAWPLSGCSASARRLLGCLVALWQTCSVAACSTMAQRALVGISGVYSIQSFKLFLLILASTIFQLLFTLWMVYNNLVQKWQCVAKNVIHCKIINIYKSLFTRWLHIHESDFFNPAIPDPGNLSIFRVHVDFR